MQIDDNAIQRRIRAWTARPTEAIRYGIFARISDWLCAGRDAKAGLAVLLVPVRDAAHLGAGPTPPAAEGTPPADRAASAWGTPRTLYLNQLGRGRADREWTMFQAEVTDLQVALSVARAEQASAVEEIARLRAEIDQMPRPTDAELEVRLGGETETDIDVVRERRLAAYTARRTAAEAEINRLQAVVAAKNVEVARLAKPVKIRFQVAQNRADMIEAYVRRRCAAYLTRLVRKHPDGRRIAEMVRPDWPGRPAWSLGDLSPDLPDGSTPPTVPGPDGRTPPSSASGEPSAGPGRPSPASDTEADTDRESTMDGET
jgi:hypothetical protein